MESTASKAAAIYGMIISLVSFGFMIGAMIALMTEATGEPGGISRSFALWIFGMIAAYISLIFYFVDAIFSIIKIFMKIHPAFNAVLSIMLLGAIPMAIFVGDGLGVGVYIWNAYYLAVFILEIVSIVKHVKMKSSGDTKKSEPQSGAT